MSAFFLRLFLVALLLVTLCLDLSLGLTCYDCATLKTNGARSGGTVDTAAFESIVHAVVADGGAPKARGGEQVCSGSKSSWSTTTRTDESNDPCGSCYNITTTFKDAGKMNELTTRACVPKTKTTECEDKTKEFAAEAKKNPDAQRWDIIKSTVCYCSEDKCNHNGESATTTKPTPPKPGPGPEHVETDPDYHEGAAGLEGGKLGWIILLGLGGVVIANFGLL